MRPVRPGNDCSSPGPGLILWLKSEPISWVGSLHFSRITGGFKAGVWVFFPLLYIMIYLACVNKHCLSLKPRPRRNGLRYIVHR